MRRGGLFKRTDAQGRTSWGFRAEISPPGAPRRQYPAGGAQALNALLVESDQGTAVVPSRLTVGEYMAGWLEALGARGCRPKTISTYESLLRNHVSPALGYVRLQALSTLQLDRLYARLRLEKGLSPRTVRMIHSIIRQALGDAQRQSLIARNVADVATPPSRSSAQAPERQIWTEEQLRSFLAGIEGHLLYPLVVHPRLHRHAPGRAMRPALVRRGPGRRPAVRAPAGAAYRGSEVTFAEPKTANARRSIALDSATVAVLRAQKARQAEWRLAVGPGWRDSGLVFTQPDGSPLSPNGITKVFRSLVERSGLPLVDLHGLRHSHTAHLLMAGVPALTVSRRLGHSSVTFTQDRYGHLLPDSQDAVVAAIERVHAVPAAPRHLATDPL